MGTVLYVVSLIPPVWAMAVNPYLETGVRIQQDRGQRVFTSGPYRFVRHPVYVGVILNQFAAPQLLGSMWAYAPALAIVVLFIVRTAFESHVAKRTPGIQRVCRAHALSLASRSVVSVRIFLVALPDPSPTREPRDSVPPACQAI